MDGYICTDVGPNKKLAKRAAAESMLSMRGLNKNSPTPCKSSLKQPEVCLLRCWLPPSNKQMHFV